MRRARKAAFLKTGAENMHNHTGNGQLDRRRNADPLLTLVVPVYDEEDAVGGELSGHQETSGLGTRDSGL